MCLGARALVVDGRFVGGGYLCALELVSCWLVCLVGSWLVCPLLMPLGACVLLVGAWWWLPACLGARALVVRGWRLLVCLGACALVVGVVLCRFVGGYLYALELVLFERLYKFYLYKQLKI